MKKEEQLAKNTAILTVGTLFTKILAFIVIPLFSSWLSVSDYGKYDLYNTYITPGFCHPEKSTVRWCCDRLIG